MIIRLANGTFKGFLAFSILAASLCFGGCHEGSGDGAPAEGGNSSAVTYSMADLNADWAMSQISVGATYWLRGILPVGPGGDIDSEIWMSWGNEPVPIELTMEMTSAGLITVSSSSTFVGGMDAGKTVLVGTDGEDECALTVCTKLQGEYSLPDLEGAWGINSLNSGGSGPFGEWGIGEIDADGAVSAEMWDSLGNHTESTPGMFTMNITEDGEVSIPGLDSWRGWLDAGRTVLVQTFTISDDIVQLTVLTKRADSYSEDDLEGTWLYYSLASGEYSGDWARGTLTVGPGGEFTTPGQESPDGTSSDSISGIISITRNGNTVITLDEEHGGAVIDTGHMDAGKTVMAFTSVWYDSGDDPAAEMIIMLKQTR